MHVIRVSLQVKSLSVRAEQANRLKDELDECREALQTSNQLVTSAEQWKRRGEESNALRLRCNKLELDNTAALNRLSELEQVCLCAFAGGYLSMACLVYSSS